jgi:hypothetical protein
MNTLTYLVIWYCFYVLLFLGWQVFWHIVCFQKFRGEDGDATTEVGYEEYPTGTILSGEDPEDYQSYPHIAFGADHHTGSSMF